MNKEFVIEEFEKDFSDFLHKVAETINKLNLIEVEHNEIKNKMQLKLNAVAMKDAELLNKIKEAEGNVALSIQKLDLARDKDKESEEIRQNLIKDMDLLKKDSDAIENQKADIEKSLQELQKRVEYIEIEERRVKLLEQKARMLIEDETTKKRLKVIE